MNDVIVILGAAAVFALGVLAFRPLLLKLANNAAQRDESRPIPADWFTLLKAKVPAADHLDDNARMRLLRTARELMEGCHWEGCGGLSLSEDMRLVIAAQASLLTLGKPGEPFPRLREILVYPSTFVGRRVCDPRAWLHANEPAREVPELGESWSNGIIVIAWDAVVRGAADPGDGHNVVLHEFAHELAAENQLAPRFVGQEEYLPMVPDPKGWERTFEEAFQQLSYKVERSEPGALDRYGATNRAEFFAVATETFFEKPRALKDEYPALYQQMQTFFRQDPVLQESSR